MTGPSFSRIFAFHDDLEEVLALHQESLLLLELALARELLGAYRRLLAVHMHHEEQQVLPVFQRLGRIDRWPVVLYTGQHAKMRGLLDRIEAQLGLAIAEPRANIRRVVIRLLDLETSYKHLAEHHDAAERQGLAPNADRAAEPDERAALLETFCADWKSALDREAPILARAQLRLSPGGDDDRRAAAP